MEYNRAAFGLSWLVISIVLEIWWVIAVIVSAAYGYSHTTSEECRWTHVADTDWFGLIILILIFFGQFSIGELIGMIEYHKSKNFNIAWMSKWMIITLQIIAGIYLCLNVLAVAQNGDERTEGCMTGQIMLVSVVVNLAYCIVTFVFCFITLPLADVNAPDNQNKVEMVPQKDAEEEEEEVGDQDQEKKSLVVDMEQKESDKTEEANTTVQSTEQQTES
mmetsp:Transcript_68677/g.109085  ORF Transcript_68677/g.109085 Transcript_68677/m.109085 type:complete len:219 (-) Transcript_68677:178-834(-)|eukprot:CAMPEP_0197026526 /NCGR_PEP_ID=MMETSP1384-20130603/6592_1 /TAXON_ID=29189 /ORGANISM="Ammonia sp." /LENGTH=218 /DNA_ID=CAMNT_0042455209 /DNA_START=114 /DNA_END=770 /DNA_ORIENTATION=+